MVKYIRKGTWKYYAPFLESKILIFFSSPWSFVEHGCPKAPCKTEKIVFMCKVATQARNEAQRTTALEAMCKENVPRKVLKE